MHNTGRQGMNIKHARNPGAVARFVVWGAVLAAGLVLSGRIAGAEEPGNDRSPGSYQEISPFLDLGIAPEPMENVEPYARAEREADRTGPDLTEVAPLEESEMFGVYARPGQDFLQAPPFGIEPYVHVPTIGFSLHF
jgi:hypothetical protein